MNKFTLSLFIGTILFTQTLRAALPSDSIKGNEIKEITVFGGLPQMLALPMLTVNSTALQSASFVTPADVLQRTTGIALERDGIWATSVNIRGLSEQRLLFLVDGDRIQTATDIAAALSTVDMNNLEKIEVIKGASSVLYGTGAMGGVINFVTERPAYTSTFQTKGKVGSEFNTVNSLWANSAYIQFSTNQWYLSLNGSYRTAQNIQTPDGKLGNSQFNDASWGLNGGIKYSPNQELLVNYQHFGAWNVGLPGGNAFPASSTVRYKSVDRNQFSGEYIITDINRNLREVRLKAYTQDFGRDVENIVNPTTRIYPGSQNRTYGAKGTADYRFDDYHTLLFGAEGWERKSESSRLKFITTSDSTSTVMGEQPTPNAKMMDIGIFAHYSWKIVPRKWTMNTGLRFDYIQQANDTAFNPLFQYTVKNGVTTNVKNLSRSIIFKADNNDDFSYAAHLDIVYNPAKQQQLGLSLSNSYRVASIEERFKYIDQAGTLRVGNPDLKPEKGTFSNFNYSLSSDRFRLKIDVFANYLFDLIVEKSGIFVSQDEDGTSKSVPALINFNVNKALFLGAEMEVNWIMTNQFLFVVNSSYTSGRDVEDNSYLPQIPPLHGFMSMNYKSNEMISGTFSALWAARQSELAKGETVTDGHVIFNFDVHSDKIDLNKSYIQLFAGVDNMLNTAYLNHLSTTRGVLRLEPGRNIYLKAKWGW